MHFQTGCLGCASGKGAGPRNIFGNKYGQDLAAVQIARERRQEARQQQEKTRQEMEAEEAKQQQQRVDTAAGNDADSDEDTDDDTDDEDGDYGPSPAAGIWAGSQKLLTETAKIEDEATDEAKGSEDDNNQRKEPPAKKSRAE